MSELLAHSPTLQPDACLTVRRAQPKPPSEQVNSCNAFNLTNYWGASKHDAGAPHCQGRITAHSKAAQSGKEPRKEVSWALGHHYLETSWKWKWQPPTSRIKTSRDFQQLFIQYPRLTPCLGSRVWDPGYGAILRARTSLSSLFPRCWCFLRFTLPSPPGPQRSDHTHYPCLWCLRKTASRSPFSVLISFMLTACVGRFCPGFSVGDRAVRIMTARWAAPQGTPRLKAEGRESNGREISVR